MSLVTCLATAPGGLEGVVAQELRALGYEAQAYTGGARFEGKLEDALRANLWLRTADRVQILLGSFPAQSFTELFEGIKKIPWEDYLPKNAAIPVNAKCAKSKLMSVPDTQAISKKAIVNRLAERYGLTWLPEDGPRYSVNVHIHGDEVSVTLDTTGAGLARRGYRTWNGEAPLRETLAASLLLMAHWYPDQPLCDPMCGTGTIAIEAAMMALDRAPGLQRSFDMESWQGMNKKQFAQIREEAQQRAMANNRCEIFAGDIDPSAVELAKRHIAQAGLEGKIRLRCCDFSKTELPQGRGAIVCNPPYGMRLMEQKEVQKLVQRFGAWYQQYPSWNLAAISAQTDFERCFGRRAYKRRKVYNGNLACQVFLYRRQRQENAEDR